MVQTAICPGSYDPVTKGHVNIVERCAQMFGRVVVVVMHNPAKSAAFTAEERAWMLRLSTRHLPQVEVDIYGGLVADYAHTREGAVLVKGLRTPSDFEYEFQMGQINKNLNPQLETLFLNADARYAFCSSSAVKAIARCGGNLDGFVPREVREIVSGHLAPRHGAPPLQVAANHASQ